MRKMIQGGFFIATTLFLSGCGMTLDEQVNEGIANAQAAFNQEPVTANIQQEHLSLYLPESFNIEMTEDTSNYLLKSDDQQYILFINENESLTSKLNYDLLVQNREESLVNIETIEGEKEFGFVAVSEYSEEQYELIVSIGGVKLSTVTNDKKIDSKLEEMMAIVRSVEIVK